MTIDELVNKYETEVRERSVKKNPQYYHAVRNYQWAVCLQAALNSKPLPEEAWSALCGERSVKSTNSAIVPLSLNPKPGDNVMDILDKYREVPGIHDMLNKAIHDAGYHVEGFYVRENK